jgi:predicted flap endonuclease-1-like 5' DNA nuclease
VSYAQIAALTDAEITELETNVIKFAGRIKRDDWIGQATQLMAQ